MVCAVMTDHLWLYRSCLKYQTAYSLMEEALVVLLTAHMLRLLG